VDWILVNKEAFVAVIFAIVRLMESVAVLAKSQTAINAISILKEFFRFG